MIQPDPKDDGPDGINLHDWDGDGDLDIFSNAEEGRYSRLYFNPGPDLVRELWKDFIEFSHGKCEDSGIGDLDADGDIDYVANGGWIFFNPGTSQVRDRTKWQKMTLFDYERRVPTVADVDGDGLNDLIVGAQEWYRQPRDGKHEAKNWRQFTLGKNRWPMNCIRHDVNGNGLIDLIVPDRGKEVCWYENPGAARITAPWRRKTLHAHQEPMFMAVADLNQDGVEDSVITGGSKGELAEKLIILIRTNRRDDPQFQEVVLDQVGDSFPKGVAVMELNGDPERSEILVIPRSGNLWMAYSSCAAHSPNDWQTCSIEMPGADTRKKMDNAWLGDLDGDGDLDIATTEENGGWGVIWFENPATTRD
ncbi:MAG: VCBS repeat-containing protein [Planctomycetales bacterium]|nr:VCBS repeat-containing protein [Planctomycetales bacterium]